MALLDDLEERKRRKGLLRYFTVSHFNLVLILPSQLNELEPPLRSLCETIALPHSSNHVQDVSDLLDDIQEVLISYQVCLLSDFPSKLTKKADGAPSRDLPSMLQTDSE